MILSVQNSENNFNPPSSALKEKILTFINGKKDAFEHIYNAMAPHLITICKRYAANHDEAKDILQESFIKIYKNINKYDFNSPFEGWVKRITINTAIDHYRKNINKTFKVIDNFDFIDEEEVFVSNDILQYDIEKVMEAIQSLPDGYRIILNLYVLENKTHKEISELLGINESTSRSQLTKARKTLKTIFEYESR